ncbi:MAG: efflux RND transporter periplasmic adaptor subunit [Isosphaeraceae bacterium]
MIAKLLSAGLGVIATLAVIWQASQAGWVRTPTPTIGTRPAKEGPGITRRRPDSVIAEGRLVTYPGAEVVVAVEQSGLIVSLPVREKSVVRKGDLIAELKSDELRASREEADARIEEAEADIHFYEREVERRRVLIARHAASDVELDTNQRGLEIARARRRAALAVRRRLDVLIDKTRITSPIDGVVIARHAHPGEAIEASTRLVTVADLNRVRVEAEVDEIDIGAMVPGAEATIFAEGFPGRTWRGRVEEIPDSVAGRHLRPEDTSRPVDTRVLLVKIALLEPTPLKLGQRIEVEILSGPR